MPRVLLTAEEKHSRKMKIIRKWKKDNKEKHCAQSLKYYHEHKDEINRKLREKRAQKALEKLELINKNHLKK
jgi:beta-lactamase class D